MHRKPTCGNAIIFALLTTTSSLSLLQADDIPTSTTISALHHSIQRLEQQREELLTQLKALGAAMPSTSLQDAIALCNSKASKNNDAHFQVPLTEDEVVAAITMFVAKLRQNKSRHEAESEVIQCLDHILQDRKIPMDAKLELITEMKTADGTLLDVCNVQLITPADMNGNKYGVPIRESFIRVRPVDPNRSSPATAEVKENNAG